MCNVISKEFKVVAMKNRGLFKDYAELVPKAAQHFLRQANNIEHSTGIEVSVYEPPKTEGQPEGTFYVGFLVEEMPNSLPKGMEYLHVQHNYGVIRGKVTEMGNLYSQLDQWIVGQGYQYESPEHYIIEVYYPVENDAEDVEVYVPVKKLVKA